MIDIVNVNGSSTQRAPNDRIDLRVLFARVQHAIAAAGFSKHISYDVTAICIEIRIAPMPKDTIEARNVLHGDQLMGPGVSVS